MTGNERKVEKGEEESCQRCTTRSAHYNHSPASSASSSGNSSSDGPKSISVIAFNTSDAVIDLPDLANA